MHQKITIVAPSWDQAKRRKEAGGGETSQPTASRPLASLPVANPMTNYLFETPPPLGVIREVRVLLEFPRLLKRILSLSRKAQHEIPIIGWSLGGFLAREIARERPDVVQRVITLGTPVIGGPKYTVVAHAFRRRGIDMDAIEAEIEARNRISLRTPVTAIYSRADAIVAWEACIDRATLNIEHIEVRTAHIGFGFCPEVYKIIAQRLAQDGHQCHPPLLDNSRERQASSPRRRRRQR